MAQHVSGLTLSPSDVPGGTNSTGTVTISANAPDGGFVVNLKSDVTVAATVPANVTVLAGQKTAQFTVTTYPVSRDRGPIISAQGTDTGFQTTASRQLIVREPAIASIAVNKTSVLGGSPISGSFTLTSPAFEGMEIGVGSSFTTNVAVKMAQGAKKGTFTVITTPLPVDWEVQIGAYYQDHSGAQTTFTILAPRILSLVINPSSVVGGTDVKGSAYITGPAPEGGLTLDLTTENPAVDNGTVTIPEGKSSAYFTLHSHPVNANLPLLIDITGAGLMGSAEAQVTLTTAGVRLLSFAPSAVTGGMSSTGKVTLTGPAPDGGAVVYLFSDNPAVTVPASVTVLTGDKTATFTANTSAVAALQSATIHASTTNDISGEGANGILKVNPPKLLRITFNVTSVAGGKSIVGTVTLNGPAPEGGVSVDLSSDNSSIPVPGIMVIAVSHEFGSFNVTTRSVGAITDVHVSASVGSITVSRTVTVNPAVLTSVTVSPGSIAGGTMAIGTVTLSGPAPAGGTTILLASSNAAAMVDATVVIPEGATTATFTVSTSHVGSNTNASISATLGSVTKSKAIIIRR